MILTLEGRKSQMYGSTLVNQQTGMKAACSIELSYSGRAMNLQNHLGAKHSLQYSMNKLTTRHATFDNFVQ